MIDADTVAAYLLYNSEELAFWMMLDVQMPIDARSLALVNYNT
jgi:hypothetical protein